MRIAVLSPVWFPVPPRGYGGIEWIVSLLADGLVDAGHEVTLFAAGDPGDVYEQVAQVAPRTRLVSISMKQRQPRPRLPWLANIPNALDFSLYPVHPHRGDYLLFLGRMNREKGAHRAVAVATEAGLPLKLAGKMREPAEQEYFRQFIAPHLRDGEIEYLGEVTHGEKVELLRNARATLFPIDWEEPFGLVMIESMACGTPVIATRRGAVPEVIEHGRR